jgi:hypothetical protein
VQVFNLVWSATVGWWPTFTFKMITLCACGGLALTLAVEHTTAAATPRAEPSAR